MHKKLFLLFIVVLTSWSLNAQFGVSGYYNMHQGASDWDEGLASDESIKANGLGISLTYWFRLKNYRIEFMPEVSYASGSKSLSMTEWSGDFEWQQLALYFNTNIYPFDLEGDCNCPTFGKDGNFLQKGFFIQISPGIALAKNLTDITLSDDTLESSDFYFLAGIGAGVDIGIAEYFTITPFIRYHLGFSPEWQIPDTNNELVATTSVIKDLQLGLNLTYRLDYKRR